MARREDGLVRFKSRALGKTSTLRFENVADELVAFRMVKGPPGARARGRYTLTADESGKQTTIDAELYLEATGLTGVLLSDEKVREIIARYNLDVGDVFDVLEIAVGGMVISETIEGRERYTINVRYPRELRDDVAALGRVLVRTSSGAQIPLETLGKIVTRTGPPMVLDENGALAGYVYVDLEGRDTGGYVQDAKLAVERDVHLPPGTWLQWTGQYEYLERMQERMKLVVPLTLAIVFVLLYVAMRSAAKTMLVMMSVPLSLVGGIALMWWQGYATSVAVWAGAIALIGVAVETTSIMIVFLDEAWAARAAVDRLQSRAIASTRRSKARRSACDRCSWPWA